MFAVTNRAGNAYTTTQREHSWRYRRAVRTADAWRTHLVERATSPRRPTVRGVAGQVPSPNASA